MPQLIHWFTALAVIVGWLLGQFGDDLPKGEPRDFGLLTHMVLGQCVIALLLVRLMWRIVNPVPPPEATPLGRFLELAAKASHFTLYTLLLLVPCLGIIVQLTRGHDLPIFGLWDFASPWPADRAVARTALTVHQYLANALLILAGVHAGAALVHHWVWRDRTLVRMLPGAA
jgi:cytochrome b561